MLPTNMIGSALFLSPSAKLFSDGSFSNFNELSGKIPLNSIEKWHFHIVRVALIAVTEWLSL